MHWIYNFFFFFFWIKSIGYRHQRVYCELRACFIEIVKSMRLNGLIVVISKAFNMPLSFVLKCIADGFKVDYHFEARKQKCKSIFLIILAMPTFRNFIMKRTIYLNTCLRGSCDNGSIYIIYIKVLPQQFCFCFVFIEMFLSLSEISFFFVVDVAEFQYVFVNTIDTIDHSSSSEWLIVH